MKNTRLAALAMAALAATAARARNQPRQWPEFPLSRIAQRLRSKRYPSMVTSSDAEIAEHNANVNTRQVRRRAAMLAERAK